MSVATECSNCGAAFKDGVFKSVKPLADHKIDAINDYSKSDLSSACTECGDTLFTTASNALIQERNKLRHELGQSIGAIPILSLQSPLDWKYKALDIVTAQSTTGTGLFSDVASAWTDAFGMQSGSYNRKIKAGENLCQRSLRQATLELGGNAVIAADVDYAEVGGNAAMLMVCMTGTAVRLINTEILGAMRSVMVDSSGVAFSRLSDLGSYQLPEFAQFN